MSTAAIILSIVYVIVLTSYTVPRSIGLEPKDSSSPPRRLGIASVYGLTQGVMAILGMLLGSLMGYLFASMGRYMVFAMMLVVTLRMFLDSMRVLKGKMLFTFSSNWGFLLLALLSGMNTFLMTIFGPLFLPFGRWFYVIVSVAAFLWAFFTLGITYSPKAMKNVSFVEFSASVFMLVIALLYMFSDILQ